MNILKIISLCSLFAFLGYGCVGIPYAGRELDDGTGNQTKTYFYAYGKFCGPGWPPKETSQKLLVDYWPPLDDLDALCYAHDTCYEIANGVHKVVTVCDMAFRSLGINYQRKYKAKGCSSTAGDMISAFFAKPDNAGLFIGGPYILLVQTVKFPTRPFRTIPEEGTCNLNGESDPYKVARDFENEYARLAYKTKSFKPRKIKILVK